MVMRYGEKRLPGSKNGTGLLAMGHGISVMRIPIRKKGPSVTHKLLLTGQAVMKLLNKKKSTVTHLLLIIR